MTKWPKCEMCGTVAGVFRCRFCHTYTCGECVTYHMRMGADNMDVDFECEHKQYEPLESNNWDSQDNYPRVPEGTPYIDMFGNMRVK